MPFRRAPDQSSCDDHLLTRHERPGLVRSGGRFAGLCREPPRFAPHTAAPARHSANRVGAAGPVRNDRGRRPSQEGLLLALDDLFRIDSLSDRSASVQGERSIKLVQRIDDYVAAPPTAPIYTADLAGEFGVSIRTLGGAVSKVRGMSLHQYIRLKKCKREFPCTFCF